MFSKSFENIKRDISTGQGFGYSLFGRWIKPNDVAAINNYAVALKNGASTTKAWQSTMSGASVAAKQYIVNSKKAGVTTAGLTQGLKNMTLGAKASTIAVKALGIAKQIAFNVGITLLVTAIAKGIDYLANKTQKLQEALESSLDAFKTVDDELKSLQEELATASKRLRELQNLADSGTISIAEEAELENLKKTNKELAKKIALKQQEQAQAARDVLRNSKKNANSTVASKYDITTTASGNYDYGTSLTPDEELTLAINAYKTNNSAADSATDKYFRDFYTTQASSAASRVEEMYALISPAIDAYEDLIDAGIELTGTDKTRYQQLKESQSAYLEHIYAVNGTKEAFEALNIEQQRAVLLSGLIKKGLSEDVAKAIVGAISDEDLSNYWDKGFSFVPPEMKDGETAEEYGKRYAEAWANGLKTATKSVYGAVASLGELSGASDKIKALGDAFNELSDSGYITTKTLGELQSAAGLSGDEWESYQNRLMQARSGSSDFNQVMSELTYRILDQTFANKDLNDLTETQIEAILRENGVVNASTTAHNWLLKAKAKEKVASKELVNGTELNIDALMSEATACGITKNAYLELVAKEIIFNRNDLDVTDKVKKLNQIAVAAGIAGINMDVLNSKFGSQEAKNQYVKDTGGKVVVNTGVFHGQFAGNSQTPTLSPSAQAFAPFASKYINQQGTILPTAQTTEFWLPDGTKASSFEEYYAAMEMQSLAERLTSALGNVTFDGSGGSSSVEGDKYYSAIDAWLAEAKRELERLEKDQDALNRQFESVLSRGNKQEAEILRAKLSENATNRKNILHSQNIAHRITRDTLLNSLYSIAPELSGKSWERISEVELYSIENKLEQASSAKNSSAESKTKFNLFKGVVEDLRAIDETIKENSATWWELDSEAKDYWQSQIDFQEEYSRTWIETQKDFDKMTDEEELAAYARMVNNNREFQNQILSDTSLSEEAKLELIKDTNDKILAAEKDAYDKRKEVFEKATEFGSTYLESKKTLLESYHDVTNAVAEAQHDINKELETSQKLYEYLDEKTRKLLFNQEDYNELSEELLSIQSKADALQRQYESDLSGATLETIESITSQYEMQYKTLMKSYEIAKADLEVAKKKQKLNNVLNERNVRMFVNGSWQWVANTEDVVNAQSELADAQYAKRVEEAGRTQQQSIDNLTKQQDELGVVVKQFKNGIIDLDSAVSLACNAIGNLPNALLSMMSNAGGSSSGGKTGSKGYGITPMVNATATTPDGKQVDVYIEGGKTQTAGLSVGTIVHTAGGDYKITGGTAGNYTSEKVKQYAGGTGYTSGGLSLMGENGFEAYINSNGRLIPINQPTIGNIGSGGAVFNADQMKNLRTLWDMSNLNLSAGSRLLNNAQQQQASHTTDNRIIINGMTVDSGSSDGQALISALRRYVGNH